MTLLLQWRLGLEEEKVVPSSQPKSNGRTMLLGSNPSISDVHNHPYIGGTDLVRNICIVFQYDGTDITDFNAKLMGSLLFRGSTAN